MKKDPVILKEILVEGNGCRGEMYCPTRGESDFYSRESGRTRRYSRLENHPEKEKLLGSNPCFISQLLKIKNNALLRTFRHLWGVQMAAHRL